MATYFFETSFHYGDIVCRCVTWNNHFVTACQLHGQFSGSGRTGAAKDPTRRCQIHVLPLEVSAPFILHDISVDNRVYCKKLILRQR